MSSNFNITASLNAPQYGFGECVSTVCPNGISIILFFNIGDGSVYFRFMNSNGIMMGVDEFVDHILDILEDYPTSLFVNCFPDNTFLIVWVNANQLSILGQYYDSDGKKINYNSASASKTILCVTLMIGFLLFYSVFFYFV